MEGSRTLGILDRIPMAYLGEQKVRNFRALSTIWSAADALDLCIFAVAPTRIISLQEMGDYLGYITGWKTSAYEIMRFGERRIHLMRLYNLREGVNPSEDILPERFFQDPLTSSGRLEGVKLDKELFSDLIIYYYRMMGWDASGKPLDSTLMEHHLDGLLD